MGRQVNFFMAPEDDSEFFDSVLADTNVLVLPARQTTPEINRTRRLPTTEIWCHRFFFLWNSGMSPEPKFKFVKEQEAWYPDAYESELIEVSRCVVKNSTLSRGRIWAELSFWDLGGKRDLIHKGEAFTRWYGRIAGWLRRKTVRMDSFIHVLAAAQRHLESGDIRFSD